MSDYVKAKGKYSLKWVQGFDNLGRPIMYKSIVPVEEIVVPDLPKKACCFHEFELYQGFFIEEYRCKHCNELKA